MTGFYDLGSVARSARRKLRLVERGERRQGKHSGKSDEWNTRWGGKKCASVILLGGRKKKRRWEGGDSPGSASSGRSD